MSLPFRPALVPVPPPARAAGPVDGLARTAGTAAGRPLLPAALRPVWRADGVLQFGLDPERAVVVEGIDEPVARALIGLDGTRTEPEVLTAAASAGLDPGDLSDLLDDLREAGVLAEAGPSRRAPQPPPPPSRSAPGRGGSVGVRVVDRSRPGRAFGAVSAAGRLAPDLAALSLLPSRRSPLEVLRRRQDATVIVHCAGRVGVSLATVLAAAGVGRVHVADRGPVRPGDTAPAGIPAGDVDRSRSAAAADAVRRAAPEARSSAPPPGRRPDLVVLASTEPVDTGLRTALVRNEVPHLVAGVRETTALVGPLVLPGRTGCLRCADLHRSDRDPAWPVVAAQLLGVRRRRDEPCDVALATFAASLAALQCLAHLDGRPAAATGATLEFGLTDARLRRRSWPPHPRCDCGAAA